MSSDDTINKPVTEYQLGVPVTDGKRRQGHHCCGGCCDMRRAVIVVNLVNLALVIFGLFGTLSYRNVASNPSAYYDDDKSISAFDNYKVLPLNRIIAMAVIRIVASALGVFGGFNFNVYTTGMAAAVYCVDTLMALLFSYGPFSIYFLAYNALFAYPHFFFIKELRAGIMTKENYPNEKHSCCCV